MKIKSAKEMVAAASSDVETVQPNSAVELMDDDGVTFVDVRETEELRKTGKLKGAVHAPRGLLEFHADPESPNHIEELNGGKRLVLYCASGGRSALAAKTLKSMGLRDVAHVPGGLPALKKAGAETEDAA